MNTGTQPNTSRQEQLVNWLRRSMALCSTLNFPWSTLYSIVYYRMMWYTDAHFVTHYWHLLTRSRAANFYPSTVRSSIINSDIIMHWNSKWKEIALCTTCTTRNADYAIKWYTPPQSRSLWNLPISFKSLPLPPGRAWISADSIVCQSKPSTSDWSSERKGAMARSIATAPIHSRRQRAPFTAPKSQFGGCWVLGDVRSRATMASSTTLASLHARRQVGKLIRKCFVLPRGVDDLVVLVEWQNS